MVTSLDEWLADAQTLLQETREQDLSVALDRAVAATVRALRSGGTLLVCGNGGSAADAQHIVGELVGRFLAERQPIRALCLSASESFMTAWANDYDYDTVFSRQVEAYAEPGSVLLGLSTSGNSTNVVRAFEVAKARGLVTIGFTGAGGGAVAALSDHLIAVPSRSTPAIQQVHLCLYHYYCAAIERAMIES
ncbi:MAG: SIS domain-containing protein [Geminicoccaceae bacterium]